MLIGKSEARSVENFDRFLMHVPRLEILKRFSWVGSSSKENMLFAPSSKSLIMDYTLPSSGLPHWEALAMI